MINAVPEDKPETIPDEEPTIALVVLLLSQVPPVEAFASVEVAPSQA